MAVLRGWYPVQISSPDVRRCHACRQPIAPRVLSHSVLLRRATGIYERHFCSVQCEVPWLMRVVLRKVAAA